MRSGWRELSLHDLNGLRVRVLEVEASPQNAAIVFTFGDLEDQFQVARDMKTLEAMGSEEAGELARELGR